MLVDILAAAPENQNLLQWHREATAARTENRFVSLLCKIPQGAKGNERVEVLKKLNALPKEEFEQFLNLLEHDVIQQGIARITGSIVEKVKRIHIGDKIADIDRKANRAAENLRDFSVRLRARHERRR